MAIDDGLKSGTKLRGDKYIIEKAIGQGGFGITYKAKANEVVQGSIGKMEVQIDVAIKEFFLKNECERNSHDGSVSVPTKKKLDMVDSYKKKFLKEASNISKLQHNNIVKVIDVFEENETVYYVMQFIDGESLDDKVRKNGVMSEHEAVAYIEQLAAALDYIHKRRLTHLDIKPANILVDKAGCLKLIDFGLAKHYDKSGNATSTGTSQGVSEGFSPIEQYSYGGVSEFSPQSDIFSVGATLAYLLTGKVPAKATEQVLPELPESISETVRMAVFAAMQPRKNDRPKDIEEFMFFLKGFKKPNFNAGATRPTKYDADSTIRMPHPSSSKSGKTRWLVIAAVAVVGFVVAFSWSSIDSDDEFYIDTPVDSAEWVVEDSVVVVETVTDMKFKNSAGVEFVYTGDVIEGIPNGTGTGKYESGTFTGEYVDGLRAEGEYVTQDGLNKFKGKFTNEAYSEGTLALVKDGFYYEGKFKNGKPWNGAWYHKKSGKLDAKVVNGVERKQ